MSIIQDIRKTIAYAGRNGIIDAYFAALERLRQRRRDKYERETISEEELDRQRQESAAWLAEPDQGGKAPGFSILMPAYEPNFQYLNESIQSVVNQTYRNFELILADASEGDGGAQLMSTFKDSRLKYLSLPKNGGISANTNAASRLALGDYIVLLDYDDLLSPNALYEMALRIRESGAEILYSDEDKCDEDAQQFFECNRKPDFDKDYFYSNNYICHLLVMKRELFLALQLRSDYDGAQDYDLLLRAPKSCIEHVPKVLYHWRTHSGSTAGDPGSKDYAYEAGKAALEDHFRACRIKAKVTHSRHRGFYDVAYQPDIFAARKEVGIVGGKILNRRHRVTGGLMDENGRVIYKGTHDRDSGIMHRADTRQDAFAVDVRCMQIRPELGGLYQEIFGSAYQDHLFSHGDELTQKSIEFCKRTAAMGYLVVYDPSVKKVIKKG